MKLDWTWRWWDVAAVACSLAAAVWVVQYSLSHQTVAEKFEGPAIIKVRVADPLPELAGQISQGDVLRNPAGGRVGTILRAERIQGEGGGLLANMIQAKADLVITVNVEGKLRLTRDLDGFPREPGSLKAGNWVLLATDRVELSGLIIAVERFGPKRTPALQQP